jgi:hypothetical protein
VLECANAELQKALDAVRLGEFFSQFGRHRSDLPKPYGRAFCAMDVRVAQRLIGLALDPREDDLIKPLKSLALPRGIEPLFQP